MQIYLTVTAVQVQSGEPFGSSQHIQTVINPGQWETVFAYDTIKFPVVHAEVQVTILPDENDGMMTRGSLTFRSPHIIACSHYLAHVHLFC
jgi:hypothetical protein